MKRLISSLKYALIAALVVGILNACIPKPSTDGVMVEVKKPLDIKPCKHIGNTQITLNKTNALMLLNDSEKLQQALLTEARNLGGTIGANTVVADKMLTENSQAFRFYICPKNSSEDS